MPQTVTNTSPLAQVSLDDKYTLEKGRVFMTGTQALVRLALMQKWLDEKAGLKTAGFISGYRGSPLARLDQQIWSAQKSLDAKNIVFTPGINEDLGLTAVWGTQQVNLFPGAHVQGVFGMWYGKGPGVDRSMDPLKHAHAAGTTPYGGVLALMGDDHGCVSSTLGHQSDQNMAAAMVPVLYPSTVQEYLDYGLMGWAMSRFSGGWVGLKCVTELVESSASVETDLDRHKFTLPTDYAPPKGGLHIRIPDTPQAQEERLAEKLKAALAFARANNIDRTTHPCETAKVGIVSAGKSYEDVLQALADLGIDEKAAQKLGLRIYKVGMVWPLEPQGIQTFAQGLETLLVVEEKRDFLEQQIKTALYDLPGSKRPRIIGKLGLEGEPLLRAHLDHNPAMVAHAVAHALQNKTYLTQTNAMLTQEDEARQHVQNITRLPYYCAGCPHNTSTKVPAGSRAVAGIGCHYMVQWMDRNTNLITHMGGEGVNWLGHAPFTEEKHVFANLGDGTYYHSGLLAIRAAYAAGVNITYKILYNDAVAMTGGQPVEGHLTVPQIAHQVASEGVKAICVVSDDIGKYNRSQFPAQATFHHRDDLEDVQNKLKNTPGCTVLIYDQTCAAEKRRRRKRGMMEDPDKRIFINEAVCEGCGDCSVKSNCVAVEPKETEFGRKRAINQSTCNKDYSCTKGFCPSFVSVRGGKLKAAAPQAAGPDDNLPLPTLPKLDGAYDILVTGIGGTGVITIGALVSMAAHIEGKGTTVLDQTGLAQKNGAVMTHLKIAPTPADIHAVRIATGGTDLLLGCDMVVSASTESLARLSPKTTHAIINDALTPTADFTLNPDAQFGEDTLYNKLQQATGHHADFINATELATALLGDSIATNMFMLGYAWQKGLVPVGLEALTTAITLNGVAVEANKKAFTWGRRAAHNIDEVTKAAQPTLVPHETANISTTVDELVQKRLSYLTDYQNETYANRYKQVVDKIAAHEEKVIGQQGALTEAVARYLFKLMAYKDEWEVARLYAHPDFKKRLHQQFEGNLKLQLYMAPPLLARRDKATGQLQKRAFGPWVLTAFKMMAPLRFVRGTVFDIFGYTAERRTERRLIRDYTALVDELMAHLSLENHSLCVTLARIPEEIRGFGHVKDAHLEKAKAKEAELLEALRTPRAGKVADIGPLPGHHLNAIAASHAHRVRVELEHGA